MEINNSVPYKNSKLILFSIIIASFELAATVCNTIILATSQFFLGINLLIVLITLTALLYYNLIYKHFENKYNSLIRTKSVFIQWAFLIAAFIIYITFIYNPPIQPEGGGGPGGMWIIFDIFFIVSLPITINLFSFIIAQIIKTFILVANKFNLRKEN